MKKPLTCSATAILATSLLPTCLSFSHRPNHRLLRCHDSMALSLRGPSSSSSSSSSSKRSRSFFRSSMSILVPPSTSLSRHANYNDDNDESPPTDQDDDDDALRRTPRPLTASQTERRREDLRRQTRQSSGFATPGVSSALPGARDYVIDVDKTQKEYFESLGIVDFERYVRHVNNEGEDDEEATDEETDEELARLLKRVHRTFPPSDSFELQTQIEKHVALQTEKGLRHLRMLNLPRASRAFSTVYALRPDAYLWHDGLVKYYLGEYHAAAESLARNAVRYEERFGGGVEAASEERIWRDAAELKIVHCWNGGRWVRRGSGVPVALRVGDVLREKRKKEIEEEKREVEEEVEGKSECVMSLEEEEEMERESIAKERRKVIRLARELFSASLRQDSAKVALARAKLQAIADAPSTTTTNNTHNNKSSSSSSSSFVTNLSDPKQYKLHSHFYLGLHYDAINQPDESKRCMKMALRACADRVSGNGNDITLLLPLLHMTVRDWYDDDEFDNEEEKGIGGGGGGDEAKAMDAKENDEATEENSPSEKDENDNTMEKNLPTKDGTSMGFTTHVGMSTSDRILESIRESIRDMTVVELRKELKKRKLKVGGLKRVLQERLVNDLKRDAGLA